MSEQTRIIPAVRRTDPRRADWPVYIHGDDVHRPAVLRLLNSVYEVKLQDGEKIGAYWKLEDALDALRQRGFLIEDHWSKPSFTSRLGLSGPTMAFICGFSIGAMLTTLWWLP